MNFSRPIFITFVLAVTVSTAFAQNSVGPLMLDPAFAQGGKSEVDFGADSAHATCYVAYKPLPRQLNRILIAGDVFSGSEVHSGFAEYDSMGVPEQGFGTNGVANLRWNGIDHVTGIELMPDSSILAVGSDVTGPEANDVQPTLFKLKPSGTPDSSFGINGMRRLGIFGVFTNVDTFRVGSGDTSLRYLATGEGFSIVPPIIEGCCAACLKTNGSLDSSFGLGGIAIINSSGTLSPQGFRVNGGGVMFAALEYQTVILPIVLCKLRANGTPDSSFGMDGVINTGITLSETKSRQFLALYDPDSISSDPYRSLIVSAPLNGLPFILKFKLNGTLDSNFGIDGYATAPIIGNMIVQGINISNDGSILLSGSVGNVCAAAKFFLNGKLDTSFGVEGVAMLDPDGGLRTNSLIGFLPASIHLLNNPGGGQRFLGIGTSVNASGSDDFLLARYMPVSAGVQPLPAQPANTLAVYPNPARAFANIESTAGTIERITITNALGRNVEAFTQPGHAAQSASYYLDVTNIPSGAYNCTVQTAQGTSSARLTVVH